MTEVRPFSPILNDVALVHRLASHQLAMDTAATLTRGVNPLEAALLAMVPMTQLGLPTLILREGENGYIGQIRHRNGDRVAHLASIAPIPRQHESQAPWIELVEGLVNTAGKRGALLVTAEVPEGEFPTIEMLRRVGFSVYYRQTLLRRMPAPTRHNAQLKRVRLRPVEEIDWIRIKSLHAQLVPTLVRQVNPFLSENDDGLVVESIRDQRPVGFLEMVSGRSGLLVRPLLHPDIYDEITAIFQAALHHWTKAEKLPVYFAIRSYQEWLLHYLRELKVEEEHRQVVFAKYTTVRVEAETELMPVTRDLLVSNLNTGFEMRVEQD